MPPKRNSSLLPRPEKKGGRRRTHLQRNLQKGRKRNKEDEEKKES
jgi:hypothetical protein